MVSTHLPSIALLILIDFAPVFPLAATLLLLRQALSQMDVPTRQAYTMALVDPEERTAAASMTCLARKPGLIDQPGLLWPAAARSSAHHQGLFILAGTLKAAYDVTLWPVFRQVRLQEELR